MENVFLHKADFANNKTSKKRAVGCLGTSINAIILGAIHKRLRNILGGREGSQIPML
jgi:hypothetical protein